MSNKAITWAYSLDLHPSGAKFVLVTLADEANTDGEVWRGQKGIAKRCSMTDRSVRQHMADLERLGLLSRKPRFRKDGSRSSDIVTLHIDAQPEEFAAGRPPGNFSAPSGKIFRAMIHEGNPKPIRTAPSTEVVSKGGGNDTHH